MSAWLLTLFLLATPLCAWGQDNSQTRTEPASASITHPAVKLSVGQKFNFVTYARSGFFGSAVREEFWITIRELWDGGVSFAYEQNGEFPIHGIQNLSSLDDCTTLDPWWEVGENDFDDRCEIWISRQMYQELVTTGKTWLNVDTLERRDNGIRWELIARTKFLLKLKNRPVLLDVLRIKTTRGDEFTVLDDPDNPLILKAVSTFFSWTLEEIL